MVCQMSGLCKNSVEPVLHNGTFSDGVAKYLNGVMVRAPFCQSGLGSFNEVTDKGIINRRIRRQPAVIVTISHDLQSRNFKRTNTELMEIFLQLM